MTDGTQRLDKWLWHARFIKTRSQASKLIEAGKVRINREKVNKPATTVKQDDVITAIIHNRVRIIKVLGFAVRRGPAVEAQMLYEEIEPDIGELVSKNTSEPAKKPSVKNNYAGTVPVREKGTGRPTKRERRKLISFKNGSN